VVLSLMALVVTIAALGPAAIAPRSGAALRPLQRSRGSSATVWLCRPGLANDPCTSSLTTTVVSATGARTVVHASDATRPPIDCFYVYPTVSYQPRTNATLVVQPEERAQAVAQAARFSQVCRVYAPIYRQVTTTALAKGSIPARATAIAYQSLLAAWNDYLRHDNRGRGVVLIGHSQGASLLIPLIQHAIDGQPAVRSRLVSAILLGGNVTVPTGSDVGGDFSHIPACTSSSQTGCVIAYSTFNQPPPYNSLFGRVNTGFGAQTGAAAARLQVLCTNPASLSGGSGQLSPYFATQTPAATSATPPRTTAPTPWVTYPGLYTAQCMSAGGATWLEVDATRSPGDRRPVVKPPYGPTWGLHPYDINLALGNLVGIVRAQAKAYTKQSGA
jgi:hypothetical protein